MSQPTRSPRPLSVERLEDRSTPAAGSLVVTVADLGPVATPAKAAFAREVVPLAPGVFRVDLAAGTDPASAAAIYARQRGIVAAQPDRLLVSQRTPNDSSFTQQSGLTQIAAATAWDRQTGTRATIVADIDTGVDYRHPDLAANLWVNPREVAGNGRDDDGNGFTDDVHGANFAANTGDPLDVDGHGTHVAGIIGAVGNNGIGVAGVNWNTRVMALKFSTAAGGYVSDAVRAIGYAIANGARVINASWGGDQYDAGLAAAITTARNAGVIVVAAAGNDGRNTDGTRFYPGGYTVSSDNVVTVAAAGADDALASFSNRGAASVTLAAPGVNILSTLPNNRYGLLSGTSMATPHVAGAVALIWDQNPSWSYRQVIDKLKASVDPVAALSGQVATGGRLNLAKALDAVTAPPPPPATDTTGPRVTATEFAGATGGFERVRLTFSEPLDPRTFTLADIGLRGPAGGVTAAAVSGGNTQFDVTFPRQTAAGTYIVTVGEDVRDPAGNKMDQNANGVRGEVPADRFTGTGVLGSTVPPVPPTPVGRQSFAAGNVPIAVPDNGSTRGVVSVNRDVTVADLDVTVSATHTYVSNLRITITSPAGVSATLFHRRGGTGDHLTGTTFDDQASTSVAAAAAPFAGSYRPESPLSVFNGTNARGTWTLTVTDLATGDAGRLTGVSLSFAARTGTVSVASARPDALIADPFPLRPRTRALMGEP